MTFFLTFDKQGGEKLYRPPASVRLTTGMGECHLDGPRRANRRMINDVIVVLIIMRGYDDHALSAPGIFHSYGMLNGMPKASALSHIANKANQTAPSSRDKVDPILLPGSVIALASKPAMMANIAATSGLTSIINSVKISQGLNSKEGTELTPSLVPEAGRPLTANQQAGYRPGRTDGVRPALPEKSPA